jgi:glycerate kinase
MSRHPSFLIAPDKFKGSLTSYQVATQISQSILKVIPSAAVVVPLSNSKVSKGSDWFIEKLDVLERIKKSDFVITASLLLPLCQTSSPNWPTR